MKKLLLAAACVSALLAQGDEISITGGEKLPSADGVGYYYKWTSNGTLTIPEGGKKVDLLIVGGGGAGGFCRGGGGGGGGVIFKEGTVLGAGTYTITIGAGGVPDAWTKETRPNKSSENCYQQVKSTAATCGGNSSISNATEALYMAIGGGGGGSFSNDGAGLPGGCGGGSAGKSSVKPEGTKDQGYAGGAALTSNDNVSGGGGGAAGEGVTPNDGNASGNGGPGFECFITGESVRYAGGGGAGAYENRTPGKGGGGLADAGGAGNGGYKKDTNEGMTAGVDGLGGGGGGSSGSGNKWEYCIGAAGGSGVVILREAAATKPEITPVIATLDGDSLTLSATLTEIGTDPEGSKDGSYCLVKVAYGDDPEKLVYQTVKSDWTLDDPDWSYTIDNLPHYQFTYWAVRVENDVGNAPNADSTGKVLVGGNGWAVPGLITLADKSINYNIIGNYDFGGDPISAIDGDLDRRVDRTNNDSSDVTLSYDVGEPKRMGIFSMVFPLNGVGNNYIVDRMGGLAVYGSNDQTNWSLVTSQLQTQNELYGHAGEWLDYPVFDNNPYRYYEIRGVKFGNVAEMKFVSEEMGLSVNPPTVWASNEVSAADDPDGVSISGKLTGSPSLETEIYGYWAREDYDYNESDWIANGTKFEVAGAFKTDDTFTAKVLISARGRVYIRMFAKAGALKTSSYCTWGVNLMTKVATVPAYVSVSTESKFRLQDWYDGNTANFCDQGKDGYVIFDLSAIPSGEILGGVRIWPRSSNNSYIEWFRNRSMKVSISYDEDSITGSGDTLVAGREVYQIEDDSAVTDWQIIPDFIAGAVVPLAKVEEIPITLPKKLAHPHYLKIEGVTLGNLCELELRTLRESGGMYLIIR